MKRYQSCLTASLCLGLLTALAACDDHHGGYYPPPFVPTGDGVAPDGLIQGQDGNFYGSTVSGGKYGLGTVFKITSGGAESLLYSFAGGAANGATPQGVVQGSDGNLYGATSQGGTGPCQQGCGTVFSLTLAGVQTGLYFFSGAADGGVANVLVQGSDGNFYGTTAYGGVTNSACGAGGCGVVFKLTSAGTESALYSFVAGSTDGALPNASVIQGTDGNFYGTTTYGGASNGGTVFKVTPAGVETVLHSFGAGNDGALPQTPLTQGSDGNFYGTTPYGGANSFGTVFKITPAGVETVLYSFAGGTGDGAIPGTAVIQGSDGNFYGTTNSGGNTGCFNGCGVLFKITPTGAESLIYMFNASAASGGQSPDATSLLQGIDGNFYLVTYNGGQFGYGALYKISTSGAATVLYSFGTNY